MTEDVELEFLGGVGEVFYGGKGKQAVMQAAIRNYALLEVQKPELISLVAKGDVVVVVAKESGKVCATQREYELHFIQHFTFCDGKIAKIFGFCDSQSLIDAVKPVA